MLRLLRRAPELVVLMGLVALTYAVMGVFAQVASTPTLSAFEAWLILLGAFLLSLLIAIVAVIGGVGGGVLFTPLLLAFTSIDTLVIRSTGLVVAMFSGLVSSGPFMRSGLADIRLVIYCAVPIILGAVLGAAAAIHLAAALGGRGDALVRLSLGLLLMGVATVLVAGGSKHEYPESRRITPLSARLGLHADYWEPSLGRRVPYQANRVGLGAILFLGVGFVGGFFGLGGGWAVVPVLNFVMAIPLKVSAASSGVLLALGNAAAVWPYIVAGALIAVFAVPWMIGQVIGGILGAHILTYIRASLVRRMLIGLLVLTGIKLIARGLEALLGLSIPIL